MDLCRRAFPGELLRAFVAVGDEPAAQRAVAQYLADGLRDLIDVLGIDGERRIAYHLG